MTEFDVKPANEYIPFVREIARVMLGKLKTNLEEDYLVNIGMVGLYDAIEKYDPSIGCKFKNYAAYRIKGAILDQLRKDDWATKWLRHAINLIEDAETELEKTLERKPLDHEVAEKLDIPLDYYLKQKRCASYKDFVDFISYDLLPESIVPSVHVETESMKEWVVLKCKKLPVKYQWVIILYCKEDMTFLEIGEVMCLTESRVCQMYHKAVDELRAMWFRKEKEKDA